MITVDPMKRLIAARGALVLERPFWALALRLGLRADPSCKTAWTDGRVIGFNPAYVATLTHRQATGLVVHEVMHCADGHPWRRMGRDFQRWNEACDRAINPLLRDDGFELPEGVLYELDSSHKGKSAEWIYDRLPELPEGGGGGGNDDDGEEQAGGAGAGEDEGGDQEQQGTGDPLGEVRDAPTDTDQDGNDPPTEEDWRQAVQQAANMAKARGEMPSSMDRFVEKMTKGRVNWRSVTRRWAQEIASADYSWKRPNVRHMPRGLYLPSMRSEELGVLAVGLDTSGSVDLVLLAQFGGEVQAIADELRPRRIIVYSCDARIARTQIFERGEPVVLQPAGGGGTDFRPVFDAIAELDEPPVGLVYLTDLDGVFPESVPDVPTLWVTGREDAFIPKVPFGEVVSAG